MCETEATPGALTFKVEINKCVRIYLKNNDFCCDTSVNKNNNIGRQIMNDYSWARRVWYNHK